MNILHSLNSTVITIYTLTRKNKKDSTHIANCVEHAERTKSMFPFQSSHSVSKMIDEHFFFGKLTIIAPF